jgi:hypothetical protein
MRMSGRALKPVTFGQHARAWLAGRKLRASALADRTRDSYRSLLDAYTLPTFGSVPLNAITAGMVDHSGAAYSLLRTTLGTAVDRKLISTANPARRGEAHSEDNFRGPPGLR